MKNLSDVPFVVVDTETTGTSASRHRVIEVAAVKVLGGEVVDRFAQLVNPERSVPHRITRITGISTAMVFDQPTMADVMPAFTAFLGDGVFVAHNLTFDQGFVNAERSRLGLAPLSNRTLCTLRLARRLLPGLRSKGLSTVADFFGIAIDGRHRALGDAEATAEILQHFLGQLAFEHGVETLEEMLVFQHRNYRSVQRRPDHVRRIQDDVLPRLPRRPGVYFMKDAHATIVYVGKAADLSTRVRSYFTSVEAHPPRIRNLVRTVRDVTWQVTVSELEALVLESRLIKKHQPRFNRAAKRYAGRTFIRLGASHAFPDVSKTSFPLDDGAEYYGPLSNKRQAELVVELIDRFYHLRECDADTLARGKPCMYASIDRCLAPCVGGDGAGAYDAEVQRVRDFLLGRDRSVVDRLEEAMHAAAEKLEFEQAAQYRDWKTRIERMFERHQRVAGPVLCHDAVLVYPNDVTAKLELSVIRFGRHVDTILLPGDPGEDEREALTETLAAHFDPSKKKPARYCQQEVDEIGILAHWMHVHRDEVRQVLWTDGMSAGEMVREVLREA